MWLLFRVRTWHTYMPYGVHFVCASISAPFHGVCAPTDIPTHDVLFPTTISLTPITNLDCMMYLLSLNGVPSEHLETHHMLWRYTRFICYTYLVACLLDMLHLLFPSLRQTDTLWDWYDEHSRRKMGAYYRRQRRNNGHDYSSTSPPTNKLSDSYHCYDTCWVTVYSSNL